MKDRTKYRRACGGKKVKFATRQDARNVALDMCAKKKTLISYYLCSYCGGWHVGHPPHNVKQKILSNRARVRNLLKGKIETVQPPKPEPVTVQMPPSDISAADWWAQQVQLTPEQVAKKAAKMEKKRLYTARIFDRKAENDWFGIPDTHERVDG